VKLQLLINNIKITTPLMILILLTGCATNQKRIKQPTYDENVYSQAFMKTFPQEKLNVSIFEFKDYTGKYQGALNGQSVYSKVVTQDPESVLIAKLLASDWFNVLERTVLKNILTERKLSELSNKEKLSKLEYSRYALAGGIIDYESNTLTGGLGAKYFGIGGSTEYRADQMTISLRLIDIETGSILSSTVLTDQVYSYGLSLGVFQFVSYKKLLEAEGGFTRNEPKILVLNSLLEESVKQLIQDSIELGIFSVKETNSNIKQIKS